MKWILYVCTIINLVFAKDELLSKFQTCKRSDPKLNDCLKTSIEKALKLIAQDAKKLKIPSIEPVEISDWTVNGTKIVPFQQVYKNIKIYNMTTITIDKVRAEISDNNFDIQITGKVPEVLFVAQYKFDNANLLDQDITGAGKLTFIETGNNLTFNLSGQVNRNSQKPTLVITSSFYQDVVENIDFTLDYSHLEVNTKTNEHLNNNWKIIFDELTEGYSKIYEFGLTNIAKAVFSQLDYDKILPK